MKDEKLGPNRRIKKRKDFLRIQEHSQKQRSRHLLLAVSELGEDARESRIGVTVTKKVDKRAVARNRIKRWVREAFRRKRWRFTREVDLVVIALKNATELNYASLNREFHFLLCKAGVLAERGQRNSKGKFQGKL